MVACMVMALAGYLTFGDKTRGNVLNNFPSDMVMVNVARLFVLVPFMRSNANKMQLLRLEHAHNTPS